MSGSLTVELYNVFHAERTEQLGDDDAAYGVDSIYRHSEVGFGNRVAVHEFKGEHLVYVLAVVGGVDLFVAELHHVGKLIRVVGCNGEHLFALGVVEEFSLLVEELQGVPLGGVVGCGDDYAAAGSFGHNGHFGGGSRGEADVDNIKSHAAESGNNDAAHHLSGEACVATHHDNVGCAGCGAAYECCICGGKFHDIKWRESFAGGTANCAADA